jgi:hypothetical protein
MAITWEVIELLGIKFASSLLSIIALLWIMFLVYLKYNKVK